MNGVCPKCGPDYPAITPKEKEGASLNKLGTMRKARIKQNRWDNWYGYVGTRRVIAFGITPEGTAEDNAKAWLEDVKYAASVVHQWRKHLIDDKGKRPGIKALLRDPVLRRKLMIDCIIATQAREGIKTTQEQAEAAYDKVQKEKKIV